MQIFDSYIEAGLHMTEKEQQAYFAALCKYLYNGSEPDLKGAPLAVFTAIRPSLDNTKARSEAGKAGGRRKGKTKAKPDSAYDENAQNAEKQNGSKTEAKPDFAYDENAQNAKSKTEAKPDFAYDESAEANSNSKGNSNIKETTPKGVVKKARQARFSPPTAADVEEYSREKGYPLDSQRFVDFYASKGWKVGTAQMKDWKAAVRNWVRRDGWGRDSTLPAGSTGEGW